MSDRWVELSSGHGALTFFDAQGGQGAIPSSSWGVVDSGGASFLDLESMTINEVGLYVVRAVFPAWFLFQTPADAEKRLARFSKWIDIEPVGAGGST